MVDVLCFPHDLSVEIPRVDFSTFSFIFMKS